jgi:hypothetical protein
MYTVFEMLFLSNKMKQKFNFCCVLLFKPVHVQNVHLLIQYTPSNNLEYSDIWIIANGIWHVQSYLSVPLVFLVLWCTLCSLKFFPKVEV